MRRLASLRAGQPLAQRLYLPVATVGLGQLALLADGLVSPRAWGQVFDGAGHHATGVLFGPCEWARVSHQERGEGTHHLEAIIPISAIIKRHESIIA